MKDVKRVKSGHCQEIKVLETPEQPKQAKDHNPKLISHASDSGRATWFINIASTRLSHMCMSGALWCCSKLHVWLQVSYVLLKVHTGNCNDEILFVHAKGTQVRTSTSITLILSGYFEKCGYFIPK